MGDPETDPSLFPFGTIPKHHFLPLFPTHCADTGSLKTCSCLVVFKHCISLQANNISNAISKADEPGAAPNEVGVGSLLLPLWILRYWRASCKALMLLFFFSFSFNGWRTCGPGGAVPCLVVGLGLESSSFYYILSKKSRILKAWSSNSCYSKSGPGTSSSGFSWELLRNAGSQAPPQICWSRICILTRFPGNVKCMCTLKCEMHWKATVPQSGFWRSPGSA